MNHDRLAGSGSGSSSSDADVIAQILDDLVETLAERTSGLVSNGMLDAEFARNATEILKEVLAHPIGAALPAHVAVEYERRLHRTGLARAQQGRHPAESLMAAEVLFRVALPRVVHHRADADLTPSELVSVAAALHHLIWRRFPPGAIAYVEFVLNRLSAANVEVDLRVSRQLHDGIAHDLAVAHQRVELGMLARSDAERVEELDAAREHIASAIEMIGGVATDLRRKVGTRLLSRAVEEYLLSLPLPHVSTSMTVIGDEYRLAPALAEEVFAIVLEALRNAVRHSRASRIAVVCHWNAPRLQISVHDDGVGFDAAGHTASIGMRSMSERAVVVNGSVAIESREGEGTDVLLTVPIGGWST